MKNSLIHRSFPAKTKKLQTYLSKARQPKTSGHSQHKKLISQRPPGEAMTMISISKMI